MKADTQAVIVASRLFDGVTGGTRDDCAIVVDGGVIRAVSPADGVDLSRFERSYDCRGMTVLPGLIDPHVHLTFAPEQVDGESVRRVLSDEDAESLTLRALRNGQESLRGGVTTVRDCGGRGLVVLKVRDAIGKGLARGPRILASGMPITTTGGHCHFCGLRADGLQDVMRCTRSLVGSGVDFIKIMATGGRMTRESNPFAPQYTVEELKAIAAEARAARLKVAAHVLATAAAWACVEAGIDTVEHCELNDAQGRRTYDPGLAGTLKENGTWVCVTVSQRLRRLLSANGTDGPADSAVLSSGTQAPPAGSIGRGAVLAEQRDLLEAGVRVTVGSDGGTPGTRFDEFYMSLAGAVAFLGMTPAEAICAGTRRAAEALGIEDQVGSISPGMQADLLVVEGDPTRDIRALARVGRVFQAGSLVVADRTLLS